jgi:GxxExxY protein
MIDEELTRRIIKAFYSVYNTLGYGFIESVYHNAMILEIVENGLSVEVEKPIAVYYGANVIGTFEADLVVEKRVIVELKAKEKLHSAHEAQLTNYLRATDIEIGLLFNFGKLAEFKRKLFENEYKRHLGPKADETILQSLFKNDPSGSV